MTTMILYLWHSIFYLNPFTSKSDQIQISPAASPEITSHSIKELGYS